MNRISYLSELLSSVFARDEQQQVEEHGTFAELCDSFIRDVLETQRKVIARQDATTAVFYSMSNCQKGLAGVDALGEFEG